MLKNDVTYQVRLGGGYPPREVQVNSWGLNSPTAAPSLPAAIKPVTRGTPGRPTQGKQNLSYEDRNVDSTVFLQNEFSKYNLIRVLINEVRKLQSYQIPPK